MPPASDLKPGFPCGFLYTLVTVSAVIASHSPVTHTRPVPARSTARAEDAPVGAGPRSGMQVLYANQRMGGAPLGHAHSRIDTDVISMQSGGLGAGLESRGARGRRGLLLEGGTCYADEGRG